MTRRIEATKSDVINQIVVIASIVVVSPHGPMCICLF
jgi:hypothetical protein